MKSKDILVILLVIAGLVSTTSCDKKDDNTSEDPVLLSIGDFYGGGYVFFIEGTRSAASINEQHGLIAAEEDQTGYLGQGTDWSTARRMCEDLSSGGYNDWYLPTREELKLVYENLYVGYFNTYGLQSARYWTIEPDQNETAWQIHFNTVYNGKEVLCEKTGLGCVRAIRAF